MKPNISLPHLRNLPCPKPLSCITTIAAANRARRFPLLQLRGLKTKVVHYLDTPPDADELKQLYRRLKLDSPRGMMRTKDALYRELALDNPALSDEALIAAMVEHPALIERPIAVFGQQAAIGRPLENIEAILPDHTS